MSANPNRFVVHPAPRSTPNTPSKPPPASDPKRFVVHHVPNMPSIPEAEFDSDYSDYSLVGSDPDVEDVNSEVDPGDEGPAGPFEFPDNELDPEKVPAHVVDAQPDLQPGQEGDGSAPAHRDSQGKDGGWRYQREPAQRYFAKYPTGRVTAPTDLSTGAPGDADPHPEESDEAEQERARKLKNAQSKKAYWGYILKRLIRAMEEEQTRVKKCNDQVNDIQQLLHTCRNNPAALKQSAARSDQAAARSLHRDPQGFIMHLEKSLSFNSARLEEARTRLRQCENEYQHALLHVLQNTNISKASGQGTKPTNVSKSFNFGWFHTPADVNELLQGTWNELQEARARIRELEADNEVYSDHISELMRANNSLHDENASLQLECDTLNKQLLDERKMRMSMFADKKDKQQRDTDEHP